MSKRKPKYEPWNCSKCGEPQEFTQSITFNGMVGWETAIHDCGPGFTAIKVWPASKDARARWGELCDGLFGRGK